MMILRRVTSFALNPKPNLILAASNFCSKPNVDIESQPTGFDIDVMDDESWKLSTGLAQAWREKVIFPPKNSKKPVDRRKKRRTSFEEDEDEYDIDEIDGMRFRGDLFFKIEPDSKEFDEHNYNFHGCRKTQAENYAKLFRNEPENNETKEPSNKQKDPKDIVRDMIDKIDELQNQDKNKKKSKSEKNDKKKSNRKLSYNQRTDAYHKPFCLDILVSKASARACIVHRATSKVVVVAHSISKDMKADLLSLNNEMACKTVGSTLARRALADDIHDITFTPRKGDKIEGRLAAVIRGLVENGVNVEVKLKQKDNRRPIRPMRRL